MHKIKQGDTVQAIKGKDAGKKGRVLRIIRDKNKALVEGVNMIKKHKRQTRQDQAGGIISIEAPINISNLMLVCKLCNRPARVGFKMLEDGTKSRFCKACEGVM